MGRFFSNVQIKFDESRATFINSFCENEAVSTFLLAFSDNGWVTLVSDGYSGNPKKASEDSKLFASALKTSAFSVEVVDSDFALLKLCASNGGRDEVIVGDGSGYGIEKQPRGTQALWQPLLAEGRTWEQFTETAA